MDIVKTLTGIITQVAGSGWAAVVTGALAIVIGIVGYFVLKDWKIKSAEKKTQQDRIDDLNNGRADQHRSDTQDEQNRDTLDDWVKKKKKEKSN